MKDLLVIQTAFLGDAVLATALLEKLHAHFPDARIDLVVRKGNEGLFDGHPFLNTLFVWDKRSAKTRTLLDLIGRLRKARYDHVINCQRYFSTGLMTVLARGTEKIGYDKNPLALFFDRVVEHRIPVPSALRPAPPGPSSASVHEVDRLNDLIAHLTDHARPLPRLHPGEAHRKEAAPFRTTPYVCIAPASVWFTKQWPAEKWSALVRALPTDVRVLYIGSPGDVPLCEGIRLAAGRGEVLAGRLSLLGTAALMGGAGMNFVNDSAPLHMASAMHAPVVAVFCSTVPAFGFGPLHANGRVVQIDRPLECRPCGLHGHRSCPKGHFRCASAIDPAQLAAFVRDR